MIQSPLEANAKLRLWGGDGEDGATKVEVNVEGAAESSGGKGGTGSGKSDDSENSGGDDTDTRVADLEKKLDTEKQKRIQLQREKDKTLEDKTKEFDNTEAERDSYKEKYEKLLEYVETDALDSAIMKLSSARDKTGNTKYQWHDVEAVRTFIKTENIRLDIDTKSVDGLDMELKRIASEKPYLLIDTQGEQGSPGGAFTPRDQRSTGNQPFGSQARQREKDPAALRKKYKFV